ncbi:MAG: molybdopterin molybdotransferase MoeA, partial [Thermodesulfobacteriota bacterium]
RTVIEAGTLIRPQEAGLLAAVGRTAVRVYKKPVVGIISTGDELVAAEQKPATGQIRDVNTYTLSGLITEAGGVPWPVGIIADRFDELSAAAQNALDACDMVIISGGSSVGTRDLTIDVINVLPDSEILVHGIPIRPGKPTILASAAGKAFWGLPGHVASAMVVFQIFVTPFIRHIGGRALCLKRPYSVSAVLTRNVSSAQGRVDYVRVRLTESADGFQAKPILGPSGLIRPMVEADGLIEIDMNTEGLEKGAPVAVIPF